MCQWLVVEHSIHHTKIKGSSPAPELALGGIKWKNKIMVTMASGRTLHSSYQGQGLQSSWYSPAGIRYQEGENGKTRSWCQWLVVKHSTHHTKVKGSDPAPVLALGGKNGKVRSWCQWLVVEHSIHHIKV